MVQKDGLKITRGKNVLNASAHTKLPGKHGSSLQTDSTVAFMKNRQLTFVSSFLPAFYQAQKSLVAWMMLLMGRFLDSVPPAGWRGVSLFTALLRPRKSFMSVTSIMTQSLQLKGTFSLWDLASIVLRREMTYFVALFKIFPLNTKLKISIKGLFDIFLIIAHCAFDKLFTHFNNCDFLWKWHKNNYFFEIPLCICFWNYIAIKNSLSN